VAREHAAKIDLYYFWRLALCPLKIGPNYFRRGGFWLFQSKKPPKISPVIFGRIFLATPGPKTNKNYSNFSGHKKPPKITYISSAKKTTNNRSCFPKNKPYFQQNTFGG
jgi:hypothetical protein